MKAWKDTDCTIPADKDGDSVAGMTGMAIAWEGTNDINANGEQTTSLFKYDPARALTQAVVSDIRVYDRALTHDEVEQLNNEAQERFPELVQPTAIVNG